jgi:hypothetical protein
LIILIILGEEYKVWSSSLVGCISKQKRSTRALFYVATCRATAGWIGEGRNMILFSGRMRRAIRQWYRPQNSNTWCT